MVKCPECQKEFTIPKMDFHGGKEDTDNQFRYAVCSCPSCNICLGFVKV